jgi:nucleotide-binding universal stress UspA family protein
MEQIAVLVSAVDEPKTALTYGYAVAVASGKAVTLVYAYDIPMFFSPDPLSSALLPMAEAQQQARERLGILVQDYSTRYPQVPTIGRLALADPEAPLEADPAAPATLIITTLNQEKLHDWWEETPALDMLRDARHSVLAVPEGYRYEPVSHITLALRPDQAPDTVPVAALQSALQLTGAALRVVTVNATGALSPALLDLLSPMQPTYYNLSEADTVDTALADFVRQQPTGWIAVIPGTYGFWEGLFHKSHTKALAEASPIPVLALHQAASGS